MTKQKLAVVVLGVALDKESLEVSIPDWDPRMRIRVRGRELPGWRIMRVARPGLILYASINRNATHPGQLGLTNWSQA